MGLADCRVGDFGDLGACIGGEVDGFGRAAFRQDTSVGPVGAFQCAQGLGECAIGDGGQGAFYGAERGGLVEAGKDGDCPAFSQQGVLVFLGNQALDLVGQECGGRSLFCEAKFRAQRVAVAGVAFNQAQIDQV